MSRPETRALNRDRGGPNVTDADALKGKRILVVDDEPDILASIEEILDRCLLDKAGDYDTARRLLEKNRYDAAILDIMGVNGYALLEMTTKKGVPTLMLTAHALSPDNLVKSIKGGALAYVPKEKISEIAVFLQDIWEAQEKGTGKITKWFARLEPFFDEKFGPYWKEKIKEGPDFWKKYI
jgi:DNA-binding NtrC family response regulator